MKLFSKKTHWLIAVFVTGFVVLALSCETADAGQWSVELQHDSTAGSTSQNPGLDVPCARYRAVNGSSAFVCPVTAVGGSIDTSGASVGFGEVLWRRWEGDFRLVWFNEQMYGGATIRRMAGDGPLKFGLGMTRWIDESPGSNTNLTFNLVLRWEF